MIIAREPYFFCVCLTDSILRIILILRGVCGDIKDLTINRNPAADYAQHDKYDYKQSLRSQPPVQVQSDEKAKNNAAGHCQTDLQNDVKALGPRTVFFIIENHMAF